MRRSLRRMALAGLAVLLVAAVGFSGALASNTHKSGSPTVTKEPFGSVNGKAVDIYTLTNSNGMEVKILTYGGIIQSVKVPDRHGHFENVTLGFDNLDGLCRTKSVLRVHHGPVREPDRTRQVHARRRHLPAADQQPTELAPRRDRRLRQACLGRDGDPERRRRRPEAHVHEPGRRPGLPGQARVRGRLPPHGQERDPDGLPGDDRQADDRQPDEPRLLESRG